MRRAWSPSASLAGYLARSLGYDDEQRAVMAYGLGALFQMLLLLVCSLSFGLVCDCLAETMILFWGVGLLRRSTGGVHCTTYIGCICTSLVSICGLSVVCRYAVPADPPMWVCVLLGLLPAFVCLIGTVWRRAPRASANKPISNPGKIARLRKQCFAAIALYFLAALLLLFFSGENPRLTGMFAAILAVAWWSAFMLSDVAARVVERADRLLRPGI